MQTLPKKRKRRMILSLFVLIGQCISDQIIPINFVIWHGLSDACCNKSRHVWIQHVLKHHFPHANIYSIGEWESPRLNVFHTYFGDVNKQIEEACRYLNTKEPVKKYGYHAIGLSQGAQFHRGLLQRCSNLTVHSLLSLGGQHQGTYGFLNCRPKWLFCRFLRFVLNQIMVTKVAQSYFVPAQYWHNPTNDHKQYKTISKFLADINQERSFNEQYKRRMESLRKLLLIVWNDERMVIPAVSCEFGYYKNETHLISMNQLPIWQALGLDNLNATNKLHIFRLPGKHMKMEKEWFIENIITIYKSLYMEGEF